MSVITIERKVLEKNDEIARQNRALFARHGLFVINLVSSPGAGKTSILERTLEHLTGRLAVAVIEGDVQTDLDAQRVARYRRPGRADHHGRRMPPRGEPGARRPRRARPLRQ